MIKQVLAILLLSVIGHHTQAQSIANTSELLQQMLKKYQGKWPQNITLVKQTIDYDQHVIVRRSKYYEAIEYPNRIRIDYEYPFSGNTTLFVQDSTFEFKAGKLRKAWPAHHEMVYITGGLYFDTLDEIMDKFGLLHIDTQQFAISTYRNRKVYVIGSIQNEEEGKQLTIDAEMLTPLKYSFINVDGERVEAVFSKQVPVADAWLEKRVDYFQNGEISQTEEYIELNHNTNIDMRIFDPKMAMRVHWKEKN